MIAPHWPLEVKVQTNAPVPKHLHLSNILKVKDTLEIHSEWWW